VNYTSHRKARFR